MAEFHLQKFYCSLVEVHGTDTHPSIILDRWVEKGNIDNIDDSFDPMNTFTVTYGILSMKWTLSDYLTSVPCDRFMTMINFVAKYMKYPTNK